jgi:hypothetical protein
MNGLWIDRNKDKIQTPTVDYCYEERSDEDEVLGVKLGMFYELKANIELVGNTLSTGERVTRDTVFKIGDSDYRNNISAYEKRRNNLLDEYLEQEKVKFNAQL